MPVILASASERRRKILSSMGLVFDVVVPELEEVFYPRDPVRTARKNASAKYLWCRKKHEQAVIIAADTVLDFHGHCIGKPSSLKEARKMLTMLSGRTHVVITGTAFGIPGKPHVISATFSEVTFRELDHAMISSYFKNFDPLDRAGAYDIDSNGSMLISSVSGSRTNVMGLPREIIRRHMQDFCRETVD